MDKWLSDRIDLFEKHYDPDIYKTLGLSDLPQDLKDNVLWSIFFRKFQRFIELSYYSSDLLIVADSEFNTFTLFYLDPVDPDDYIPIARFSSYDVIVCISYSRELDRVNETADDYHVRFLRSEMIMIQKALYYYGMNQSLHNEDKLLFESVSKLVNMAAAREFDSVVLHVDPDPDDDDEFPF